MKPIEHCLPLHGTMLYKVVPTFLSLDESVTIQMKSVGAVCFKYIFCDFELGCLQK